MVRERGASTTRREQHPCPVCRRCRYGVRVLPRRQASPQRPGQAASSVWADAASREDAVRRFSLQQLGWVFSGDGRDLVHLSRLLPRMGQDQEGWQSGAASDGEEPLRPRPGGGHRLVPDQPASADQGPARPSERDDARPLRLLRRLWQLSATELVRRRGREHLEEMVIATGSPQTVPLEPLQRSTETTSIASGSDCPSLHHHERSAPVKNRKREFCTSGSARGEDSNVLTYSATRGSTASWSDSGQAPRSGNPSTGR